VPADHFPALTTVSSSVSLVLQAAFLANLVSRWKVEPRWPNHLLALVLLVLVVLGAHDLARWTGYVSYENLLLAPYATPFLILALGTTVVTQHLNTLRTLARTNELLEQRVDEKVREAQLAHARMNEVLREQAVLRERQRIMTDMHDGIGADLLGLLGVAREPRLDTTEVSRRVTHILADLRAIVDSLEPVEGDLGVVLGNIRYRMRAAIEQSGIQLAWQVEPLPLVAGLTPEKVLPVQRIVMEAISNALQHSGATLVTVSARARDDQVEVVIEDNGKGYDATSMRTGRGLRSMRARAQGAAIQLAMTATPGKGTRVEISLTAVAREGVPATSITG
jgi:signal transduction histidine kinase